MTTLYRAETPRSTPDDLLVVDQLATLRHRIALFVRVEDILVRLPGIVQQTGHDQHRRKGRLVGSTVEQGLFRHLQTVPEIAVPNVVVPIERTRSRQVALEAVSIPEDAVEQVLEFLGQLLPQVAATTDQVPVRYPVRGNRLEQVHCRHRPIQTDETGNGQVAADAIFSMQAPADRHEAVACQRRVRMP